MSWIGRFSGRQSDPSWEVHAYLASFRQVKRVADAGGFAPGNRSVFQAKDLNHLVRLHFPNLPRNQLRLKQDALGKENGVGGR